MYRVVCISVLALSALACSSQTVVADSTQIEMRSDSGSLQRVKTSANLADVVRALNALGATPQDLLSILQAIKSAGALNAELEVI